MNDEITKLENCVISLLNDFKAKDIKIINTSKSTALFDKIIIATATSNTHARAIALNTSKLQKTFKYKKIKGHIEGIDNGEWIVIDLNYIIVHIMQTSIRNFYNLEDYWNNITL
ncbi:ribosome silencing factor [Candidatus Kinetoplastidibacterium crithidiae]|uniref:Ribosomal silencing factor RsfS n=1 Tax=Candidatus Kinetoplastidibacterium crithidiae TCC036E TaxID=1208918 RepID=M1LTQ8_9PROT|nr:ribosome silencing factor [Candidatus Kinetoplastibacterium crithidii]AFZ82857.1 ribosome-associated protein [Candidatus Kinetoplastibacterium crithidii (ex Angomonas deanei ATCC 30255)]AGF47491.1 iojap-like ribosome-associated protein [Candidatus Kinetoplastibacterium crithidii TCC036E]